MKNSKSFCVYPWIHQLVLPTGKFGFCCVAESGGVVSDERGQPCNVSSHSFEHAWNGSFMREVRRKMLNGEKVEYCKGCDFQESIGKKSYRQSFNAEWTNEAGEIIEARVKESLENDYQIENGPLHLDLRLGNICNLRCRSCNPYNSTKIFSETQSLLKKDNEFKKLWLKYENTEVLSPVTRWYEDETFWNQVDSLIPTLRKIYLTGGEPFLIKRNFEFIRRCIELDSAKDIFLMFNTNATIAPDRVIEQMSHFKFVLINLSIDAFGGLNEYIRDLSSWPETESNFEKFLKAEGNIQVGVTPVIQIYNILNITDLLWLIEEKFWEFGKEINVDFLYATTPSYLNIAHLPQSIKAEARGRLKEFQLRSALYQKNFFLQNSIESCLNLLSPDGEENREKLHEFVLYTRLLDKERNKSLEASNAELAEMLSREGLIV